VLPVAPSLALRSAVLKATLGSAHGAGASTGITGASLTLTNTGSKALLTKGLAVIALAGVSAGAGTLALHAVSRHHPRAAARAPAKAGSTGRIQASARHLVAPTHSQRPPTLPVLLLPHATRSAARADAPLAGSSGRLPARGTRASTQIETGPPLQNAPATNSQDSGATARPQPAPVPSSVGAPQPEPEVRSNARGAERAAARSDAPKTHAVESSKSKSVSPSAGHGAQGTGVTLHAPDAAGSTAAAESGDSASPGHAYGQEASKSTPPGQEKAPAGGGSDAPGNSASAPGHSR
jgi:hypothetical protein